LARLEHAALMLGGRIDLNQGAEAFARLQSLILSRKKPQQSSAMQTRVAIALLALSLFAASSAGQAETLQQRGAAIARGLCSPCHAIGAAGNSPHAAAPRFRLLDNQIDLSKLSRRIREGLLAGHEDMPMFRFDRDDAEAIVAYIRSIQRP
jgi:mono/diheme cytochrome c family protein